MIIYEHTYFIQGVPKYRNQKFRDDRAHNLQLKIIYKNFGANASFSRWRLFRRKSFGPISQRRWSTLNWEDFFFKERPKVYLSFNMFCAFCTSTIYEWSRHWLNPSEILSCLGNRDHIKAQKLCKVNIALNSQRNLFIIITHIVYFNMLQISCKVRGIYCWDFHIF